MAPKGSPPKWTHLTVQPLVVWWFSSGVNERTVHNGKVRESQPQKREVWVTTSLITLCEFTLKTSPLFTSVHQALIYA